MIDFTTLWEESSVERGYISLSPEGVNFHGREQGHAVLVSLRGQAIGLVAVVYEDGRSHWAGRGSTNYSGAEMLTLVMRPTGDPVERHLRTRTFQYVVLSTVPVRSSKTERAALHGGCMTRLNLVNDQSLHWFEENTVG